MAVREMVRVGGAWTPTAYLADTSVKRVWNGTFDPQADGAVVLAPGDEWALTPAAAPPPPPPSGGSYVPRVVPAYGTYQPDDSTTGIVSARSALTPYNYPGDVPIPAPVAGQTYTSLEIWGDVVVQAANVTFQDCVFRGPRNWPSNDGAVVDCNSSACVGAVVRDCTFAPQLPNYYRNFVIGHEVTVERCRSIWANDHVGIYTKFGANLATNARVLGCYFTDNVYWQGTSPAYTGQAVGSFTVTTTWGASYTQAGYPLKGDGTHNDAVQIQGGLGGSRSIWCKGNNARTNDAWAEVNLRGQGHPLGWADPIPMLGTGNSPKLRTYSTGANLNPMADGRYACNGQSFVIQQNTYQFPQVDTCVVEDNWINDGGEGVNIQAHNSTHGYTSIACTVQNNHVGGNWYNFNSTNPQIYVIRIDFRADATVAGLTTNTWFESAYQPIGSALAEGRTSGIWYDA